MRPFSKGRRVSSGESKFFPVMASDFADMTCLHLLALGELICTIKNLPFGGCQRFPTGNALAQSPKTTAAQSCWRRRPVAGSSWKRWMAEWVGRRRKKAGLQGVRNGLRPLDVVAQWGASLLVLASGADGPAARRGGVVKQLLGELVGKSRPEAAF